MPDTWRTDLAILAGAAGLTVLLMFLAWEGLALYARGLSTSLVTAFVVASIVIVRNRRRASALEIEVARRTREADEARTLFQVIVDTTPAGLILLDRSRRVVQANRTAEAVHGRPLVGGHCYELLRGGCSTCDDCPAMGSLDAEGRLRRLQLTDSRTREIVDVESHDLDLGNGEPYLLLVERVITEHKKLQARMIHQEKMAAFGLLAAGIAHDMGNPLASIVAQLQLLDDTLVPPDAEAVVATVRREAQRLQRIVREMVSFARRRRDAAALVSLHAVVDDTLTLLRHDPRMRRVEVRLDADPETPPVRMVEDHLIQVVLNLMLNGLDAMPEGGRLDVEVRPAGELVALRVRDQGTGMTGPVLHRAFEPLYTTKDPGRGTGLGLSVCRDILHDAGGRIELRSTPGQGTTAEVLLPPAPSEAAAVCTAAGGVG